MKIIFVLVLISILYIIVAYLRYFFSNKEKEVKQYLLDIRTNFFIACLIFGIAMIILSEIIGIEKTNYFLSLDWLIIFF